MKEQAENHYLSDDNLINSGKNLEEEKKEKFEKLDKENESVKLLSDTQEKINLLDFIKGLEKELNEGEHKDMSFDEIYQKYYNNKFITKSHIKERIGECYFNFGFFGIGTLFDIIC